MIACDLSKNWYAESSYDKRRGRQLIYSDQAILVCQQIRYLFNFKLKQCQGFINWLFEISRLLITCPDYTTLSRRSKSLNTESLLCNENKEFDHVSIDSTGIQVYTGNEWLENKHGKRYSRMIWKKLHILVGDNGKIIANSTTDHNKDDRSQVKLLLKNDKAKEILADSGYDGENIYQDIRAKGMKPTNY
ncbi:IS5 family transposase [Candidatus Trichorickettsia mobilis]|uniref:IS5 family transposase n=1 Tax=Candidatus Trichorickettsia mobilis TaxID=1346319 RepID=A0ABZ0URF9_9RICK|nr:IS5 family transposase [Candidatus Trichorickettsia mobilis]